MWFDENVQRRRKQSWSDILVVWGFLASFLGLFGAACFEAAKIFEVVPAAFQGAGATSLQNPMDVSAGDYQPKGNTEHMTPQQRAQYGGRGAQP